MHIEMFQALRDAGVSAERAEIATKATVQMVETTTRNIVMEAIQPVLQAIARLESRMDGLEKRMDGLEKRMDGFDKRMDGFERSILRSESLTRWVVGVMIGVPVFVFTLLTAAKSFGLLP